MPYYLAVYDMNQQRVGKALKLFRRYLNWVQNSVFEGELTYAQYECLKAEVKELIEPGEDSVIFYELRDERYAARTVMGEERGNRSRFL
ncbi:MAG: CRISPR-associated endonuclease Cas2 [Bacteroidota bacterium]